jgi:chemotaxis protein methyltransferase CheR
VNRAPRLGSGQAARLPSPLDTRGAPASNFAKSLLWDLGDDLFDKFRDLIYREAGIALNEGKKSLFVSRMAGRLRELQIPSFEDYHRIVSDPASVEERGRMLDRICTNETQFFRDARQFLFLNDELFPRLESQAGARGSRRIRVWSAACSTGEEPYSLAMALLHRFPPAAGWQIEVLATDLSTKVLNIAGAGLWPIDKSSDIPMVYRKEFMLRGTGTQQGKMKAGPEIRAVVKFARLNLNDPPYPVDGQFDFIFCRNVLIYFDHESKARVVERLLDHLVPNGCLFLGYAETASTLSDRLHSIGPNVYARVTAPSSSSIEPGETPRELR